MIKIYKNLDNVLVVDMNGVYREPDSTTHYPIYDYNSNLFTMVGILDRKLISDIHNEDGVVYANLDELKDAIGDYFNKSITDNVTRHTPTVILPMVRLVGTTNLSSSALIDEYTISISDNTGMVIGQHVRIIDPDSDRFYFGGIVNINGLTITLDTPIDFNYASGSEVTFSDVNMNVDGSITPVKFKHRTGIPSVPRITHITRIIITGITTTPVDLSKFGNLNALTNGLVFRAVNGETNNIFNVKTNADLENITLDWKPYSATNPAQGIDGFSARLTFSGAEKLDTTLRVGQFDNLEMIIQDDLTGLTSLTVFLEGYKL